MWEESLVQQAANDLLARTGVLAKLAAVRAAGAAAADGAMGGAQAAAVPLSRSPGLTPEELRPVVAAFYAELRSQHLFAVFEPVAHAKQRARLRRDMASVLAAAHSSLHEALTLARHAYGAEVVGTGPAAVLQLSVTDVDTLLQLA